MNALEPVNSLESIASDMELPHEAKLHGVPDSYSWAFGPSTIDSSSNNPPPNFTAIMSWGTANAAATGNLAKNTRVQIKNIQLYILSKQTGTWNLVQSSVVVEGKAFKENFANNTNIPGDVRQEADGTISVKMTPGYNFHFWPKGSRASINPADIGGVFTTVEARLIVDNPALPDDRDQARILMGVGGDYWLDKTASWNKFTTNTGIAGGRMRYIGSDWDAFNMVTLKRDQVFSNPPPIPLADVPQSLIPTIVTQEAEDIKAVAGYRIENIVTASGGRVRSLSGGASGETGTATLSFTGAPGIYNVVLGAIDENDGAATLQVAKNGEAIGSVLLNQNLDSADTKVERSVATGVSITYGDTFTITGTENAGEAARFDFIRFEPVGGPTVPTVSIAATTKAAEPSSKGMFTVNLSQAVSTDTVVAYSVAGTATADTDYTKLSGTVTIAAGQQSATIAVPVLDDLVAEGAESVIVTLTGATGSKATLGATKTGTVTISDNDTKLSTLTLQAEAANSIVNYRTESIGAASGGKVLSFVGGATNEKGSATFVFGDTPDELTGTYDISVCTFDENDGKASFTVQLNDFETGTTTQIGSPLVLNANLGSNVPNAQTKVTLPVANGITLTKGDSLIVTGIENGGEHARLDFIGLSPVI